MSRHHGSIANEINHTIHAVLNMSPDEVERLYGIEISEDKVFDPTYNMSFNDLSEWATFCVTHDHTDQYEHISQNDDEYY